MDKSQILGLTKISEKNQTRLPVEVVKFLKVNVGDKLLWKLEGNKIIVEKA